MVAMILAGSARRTVRRWGGSPHSSSTAGWSPRSPAALPASSSYTCHSATIGPRFDWWARTAGTLWQWCSLEGGRLGHSCSSVNNAI